MQHAWICTMPIALVKARITNMAPRYKLTYFNFRGKAEVIRLLFAAAGVEFDDVRIEEEDWPTIKPGTPFGRLPILEFDGITLPESRAIAGFVAMETGLYGKSSVERAKIDVVMEVIRDLQLWYSVANVQKDERAKEDLTKSFFEKDCLKFLNWLEELLMKNQGGHGFFVGDALTMADLDFYAAHELVLKKNPTALQATPKLEALVSRVENVPEIKAWLPCRPEKFSFWLP